MNTELNLRQIVFSLSRALDLVGVDDMHHGKRVAFMAHACAQFLDLDEHHLNSLMQAAMLHDCGVSNTQVHQSLVNELDWQGSQVHCKVGESLLDSCPPFKALAPVIAYHHTHWDKLKNLDISSKVKRDSNLIFLVDRVDALIFQQHVPEPIMNRIEIRKKIQALSGTLFDPVLVDSFMQASELSAFWLTLEPEPLTDMLRDWVKQGNQQTINFEELRAIAQIFARIVDAKSPFTSEHSHGVARLARQLGIWDGQPQVIINKLELAGLLHDLGKLRIPDEILEKPGALNEREFAIMQGHSFESHHILKEIDNLQDVALWCSQHHEKINGKGYPFCNKGNEISRPARILAVADVFQALAQNRPYRTSLNLTQILSIMDNMISDGKLEPAIVQLIHEHPQESLTMAMGAELNVTF
jgi:HD-GYP domain-containing protein (c-di-GMP phosphodiesterase class II)